MNPLDTPGKTHYYMLWLWLQSQHIVVGRQLAPPVEKMLCRGELVKAKPSVAHRTRDSYDASI